MLWTKVPNEHVLTLDKRGAPLAIMHREEWEDGFASWTDENGRNRRVVAKVLRSRDGVRSPVVVFRCIAPGHYRRIKTTSKEG